MARKRASMREGPLADLFRSTEESVKPDDVKVTAKSNGARVAVEAPTSETPTPEPVPEPTPEPVPEPTPDPVPDPLPGPGPVPEPTPPGPVAESGTDDEVEVDEPEIYHEGLDRLMGGTGLETRPRYGRDEPDAEHPPA